MVCSVGSDSNGTKRSGGVKQSGKIASTPEEKGETRKKEKKSKEYHVTNNTKKKKPAYPPEGKEGGIGFRKRIKSI